MRAETDATLLRTRLPVCMRRLRAAGSGHLHARHPVVCRAARRAAKWHAGCGDVLRLGQPHDVCAGTVLGATPPGSLCDRPARGRVLCGCGGGGGGGCVRDREDARDCVGRPADPAPPMPRPAPTRPLPKQATATPHKYVYVRRLDGTVELTHMKVCGAVAAYRRCARAHCPHCARTVTACPPQHCPGCLLTLFCVACLHVPPHIHTHVCTHAHHAHHCTHTGTLSNT